MKKSLVLTGIIIIGAIGAESAIQAQTYTDFSYSIYAEGDTVDFNNISTVTITGPVRSEASKVTFNNISSFSITGDVSGTDEVKFNNSTGTVTGDVSSETKVTVKSGTTVTGTSSVVSSIGSLELTEISAPTSTSDTNWATPISIASGDLSINGSYVVNGTVYVSGTININNGASVTGTGALVAGGDIHINNVTGVGSSGSKLFFYSLSGKVHFNNLSSANVYGTVYAPNDEIHFNNVTSVDVKGGIFANKINMNNLTTFTAGAGTDYSDAFPPAMTPTVTPTHDCADWSTMDDCVADYGIVY